MSSGRGALLQAGAAGFAIEDLMVDLVQDLHESIVGALVAAGMATYSYREHGAVHTLNESAPAWLWPHGEEFDADLAAGRGRWS